MCFHRLPVLFWRTAYWPNFDKAWRNSSFKFLSHVEFLTTLQLFTHGLKLLQKPALPEVCFHCAPQLLGVRCLHDSSEISPTKLNNNNRKHVMWLQQCHNYDMRPRDEFIRSECFKNSEQQGIKIILLKIFCKLLM